MTPRLVLAPQLTRAVSAGAGELDERLRLQCAPDGEPPQRGGEIQGRAPGAIPQMPGVAKPVTRGRLLEGGVEIVAKQAGTRRGGAAADAIRFEKDGLDACGRKRRRTGGAREPSSDNHDGCRHRTAELRI